MSSTKISHYVSEEECEAMRELDRDGVGREEIAVRMARTPRTTRRHLDRRCRHSDPNHEPVEEDTLIDALRELADELGRVPTIQEWRDWADKPHNSKTVERNLGGSWRSAIKAADLPIVAPGSTKAIRSAAYQKPSLCSSD